ncbi:hypothetical protein A2W14_04425 [Candidatus Gottesmanbacteria bacterium RBG_16_37_8]|uniref:Zinc finger DksA/TraR C4-type domain-containing protein n=1 Tax=Candidatus Gottesmanbacteria bacterium RBG_16_37_8 TaxID=1798371 RepID=A0A1F5YSE0_9BACT|nr:MAG: hypothetical protein A2W14_04425 [Candidatus Gottesmanbacteria bacterium RBG_16_37_8]
MKFPKELLNSVYTNLIKLRKIVEKRISSLKLQDPFSDPDRLNDNAASDTEAKEESSHDRMEALEKVLKRNLEEINLALIRIKKGTYGKCQNCGKMIDTDRLAIKPTALYCVSCERKKEK